MQDVKIIRIAGLVLALALVALALPSSASAQATRTWVSGTGDDGFPCSRTAPCKTFAGAISKTAAKGQINCLDPGGFGGVTITKSLTIRCRYTEGGALVSGTNAIVVNAASTDRVVLHGLDINGLGTGLNGIRVLQARSVKIIDTDVFGFVRNGIDVEPPSGALARVVVQHSRIHDNTGNGVMVAPSGTGAARVTLRDNVIAENGCGITASRFGIDPAFNFASNCGTPAPNATTATSVINAYDNSISDSERHSVLANGSSATIRISGNKINGSVNAAALQAVNSGSILTWNDNRVAGNPGGDGATTGTITAQ